jgi:uncharacterized protein
LSPVPLAISAATARRFLVTRHLLDPPRGLPPKPESVLAVVERLGSLQFDPLEVPGARNHDLVLHARVAGYDRAFCDGFLYAPKGERRLFEAYNKSLNILPAHELPYYRLSWERSAERYREGILARPSAAAILARLRDEGALSTAAFQKDHGQAIAWHWAPTAEGRAVLEALFESGRVGIARRDGSRRTYDLIERLFPDDLLARRVPREEAMRHRLLSRFRGVGLLGASAGSEITSGTGKAADRAAVLEGLVREGVLVPAEVAGVKGLRYLLAEERPLLDAAAKQPAGRHVTFLAPLDPLMWDRRLLRSLFGFDYTWEVYTPEAKRKHGYYVLPILFGDRIVGRIEPKLDRQKSALRIVGLSFEEGFDPLREKGFLAALGEALGDYRRFVGAGAMAWPRGRVAAAVGKALRAIGPG